ncbi:unnamed protein product, partial [Mesorhabditis belari]|uniref:G-protein coupled receptors family 1 profile domain-containing protein n=1 Tax=Mesorhabditis belari TaxID=2138241 RepID=A0AAF3EYU2_9BILA
MHPQVFFIVVHMTITMSLAIAGNLFMIFVIWRGNKAIRRRVSPVQLLLLHTCAADLLFAVCSLGTEILLLFHYPHFIGPGWLCKLVRYAQMVPLYASPFLLVAISADRYQAICRPLAHFRRSRYRIPTYLAMFAWGLALLCSLPQAFIWRKEETFPKVEQCVTFYRRDNQIFKSIYVIVFNTIAWLLPSTMAGLFYYFVCKAVWMSHNSKPTLDLTTTKLNVCDNVETQSYVEKLRHKSSGIRRQTSEFDRKRIQTVRLTLTIIACNFFLWAPFCMVNILQANAPNLLNPSVMAYVVVLGNLNSCVNPWIYIFFNRSHVQRAFCGAPKSGKNHSQIANTTQVSPIFFTSELLQRGASPRRLFSFSPRSTTYSSCSRMAINGHSEVVTESFIQKDSGTTMNGSTTTTRNSTELPSSIVRVFTERRKSNKHSLGLVRARSICATHDEKQALLSRKVCNES